MDAILYYLLLPWIYGISRLPFWALYGLSDVLYLGIYRLVGYRRKVVGENLRRAFPDKTATERQRIERDFYRHFCDLLLETVKGLTISENSVRKRAPFADPELIRQYAEQGRSVVVMMGHQGNWEWAGHSLGIFMQHTVDPIYRPLSNTYFDGLLHRARSRFGARMVPMKKVMRHLLQHRDEPTATIFVGDQTPRPQSAHWMVFLNQETGAFPGAEKISRKFDLPVVYLNVCKQSRGHYVIETALITETPQSLPEGAISHAFMKRLEQDIQRQPAHWLWSHRRWKHQKPAHLPLYQA